MDVELVLLPSPLLGPATWRPVADRLCAAGWPVSIPSLATPPHTPDDVLAAWLDQIPLGRAVVLVPHSNAGLYVPALVRELAVAGVVFVDAGLAPPAGSVRLSPAPFFEFLSDLAGEDDVLPPWPDWWGTDSFDQLLPDPESRDAVSREAPRVPLSYFDHTMLIEPGWDSCPCAYLGFGDTYAPEQEEANGRGWQIRTLEGGHLHMLVEPDVVAATTVELMALTDIAR